MVIRPVSDLRNHFPDVERDLEKAGEVYLTKNGYGSAVVLSIDSYIRLKETHDLPAPRAKARPSARGAFKEYSDPDLIPFEKNAGRKHVQRNQKKYVPEVYESE